MPPDFGPMLAPLCGDDVRFVVGPVAARARSVTLLAQLVDHLTLDVVPDGRKANLAHLTAATTPSTTLAHDPQ